LLFDAVVSLFLVLRFNNAQQRSIGRSSGEFGELCFFSMKVTSHHEKSGWTQNPARTEVKSCAVE
jgi:hypothetical protein